MPRIIEKTVYKFNELSEKAQQNVLDTFRHNQDYPWIYDNKACLDMFVKSFPFVEISNWEYGYRNYIDFVITNDLEDLAGVRLWKWLKNNFHDIVYTDYGKASPHATKSVFESCPLTGYCVDDDLLQPLRDFLTRPKQSVTLYTLIQDCLTAWMQACNNDYEYWQSEEAIKDDIDANDYEFYDNGELV